MTACSYLQAYEQEKEEKETNTKTGRTAAMERPLGRHGPRRRPARPQFMSVIICTFFTLPTLLPLSHAPQVAAIAPTIDYSHNMRILKLPKWRCQAGDLIYRLKGSDGDPGTQLVFGVSGIEGRSLIDIVPVPKSWNEADVYLKSPLSQSSYNLTIYVSDGNKTTQVQSTILAMEDYDGNADASTISLANETTKNSLPFLNTKHVFNVPEDTEPNESIGLISVLESQSSDLPVRFELRGHGSDKFMIKYVFGPKGQSKGEIVLAQQVDYERQNLYRLKVLALNAWTNSKMDTRNVATMDIVITIGDVQDSPPVFRQLPQWLRLYNTMQTGDLVARVEAEDGDYADQRPINYALDAGSPLATYFDIDKLTGEIRLTKTISELALHAAWDTGPMLLVLASEVPDTSSYDHLWPPMYARAELPLMLVDMVNEPPQFVGGWQTLSGEGPRRPGRILHGYMAELTPDNLDSPQQEQQFVQWYTNTTDPSKLPRDAMAHNNPSKLLAEVQGRPFVRDLGLGSNGTFELTLEGRDSHLFQVEPSFPVSKQSLFQVFLAPNANRSLFDFDQHRGALMADDRRPQFVFDLIARDFGTPQRQGSRIRCIIDLVDLNDNAPQFETDLYTFTVYENAQLGQIVGSVRAYDPDSSGPNDRLKYSRIVGQEANLFHLNENTGVITLDGYLDRERRSHYLFFVEAKDSNGLGRANYSHIVINVLDVNDNAPIFLQSHYDAVLLADGTLHQPLVVHALDADEPGTANSQVVYEIVAGNQNDQFSIDTVSGAIFPAAGAPSITPSLPQTPSILREPIMPYNEGTHQQQPSPVGKISSAGHEMEETTVPSDRRATSAPSSTLGSLTNYIGSKLGWPRSVVGAEHEDEDPRQTQTHDQSGDRSIATPDLAHSYTNAVPSATVAPRAGKMSVPSLDTEQFPALDLLLNLESESAPAASLPQQHAARSALSTGYGVDTSKVPPVTTLIVRAHDFGIPLRSSTVKVNIYNQALLSRSISMILNGTSEQLEQRREAIERAFGSFTGTKAVIESIDALSDSSSLSVAKMRLAVPQHSLVDLTDLSALINAIDYHQVDLHQQARHPTHYHIAGDRLIPATTSSNITSGGFYQDISSFALDTSNLERRLLIYIIIVGTCILALLAIWMIYMCCRENDQIKLIETNTKAARLQHGDGSFRSTTTGTDAAGINKTYAKTTATDGAGSAICNNLAKPVAGQQGGTNNLRLLHNIGSSASHLNELLLPPIATTTMKDHGSIYNGQIWFEPSHQRLGSDRRASSAPSGGSLDSALHLALHRQPADGRTSWRGRGQHNSVNTRDASGQFFPNTVGYMENLAALGGNYVAANKSYNRQSEGLEMKRGRRWKVAPLKSSDVGEDDLLGKQAPSKTTRQQVRHGAPSGHSNEAFVADSGENSTKSPNCGNKQRRKSGDGSLTSELSAGSSGPEQSVILDSDQELLGFDSTGTPIIATHTRSVAHPKSLVIEMVDSVQKNKPSSPPQSQRQQPPNRPPVGEGPPGSQKSNERDELANIAKPAEITKPKKEQSSDTKDTPANGTSETRNEKNKPKLVETGANQVSETTSARTTDAKGDLIGELSERLAKRHKSLDKPGIDGEKSASTSGAIVAGLAAGAAAAAATSNLVDGSSKSKPNESMNKSTKSRQAKLERRPVQSASSTRSSVSSASSSIGSTVTNTTVTTTNTTGVTQSAATNHQQQSLRDMRNGELLEKQSIFALTYSGIATDKLP